MDWSSTTVVDLLATVDRLPTLNPTAIRLMNMLGDENATFTEIEEVVRTDPALTTNLLKTANSAYFGLGRRVETVRQAVAVLGLKRLVDVVTLTAMADVVPERLPGYQISALAYWRHCVAVAVLAEKLAQVVSAGSAGLAFTCGLLHDIGKLVVATYLGQTRAWSTAALDSSHLASAAAERRVLGIDHADVGLAVARAWRLPAVVAHVNRDHHRPKVGGAGDDGDDFLVTLVHVADAMAHALGYGTSEREFHRRFAPGSLVALEITGEVAGRIAQSSTAQIESLLADSAGRRLARSLGMPQ